MIGILLVDKPLGITSHDAVNRIRRAFSTKRVGHAGTLDPLATGLLVAAIGPATRFLQYLPLEPKEYLVTARFGVETTTFDAEGEAVAEREVPEDLDALIGAHLPAFLGEIEQVPPLYSAVKKDGKALYQYAREGKSVEREARRVFIREFERIGEPAANDRSFRIVCSGGTYIRTLAHDLGQAVGCGAYVEHLRRSRVGAFRVEDARRVDDLAGAPLIPLSQALSETPQMVLDAQEAALMREGRRLYKWGAPDGLVALLDEQGRVFCMARCSGSQVQPECVIPAEAMDDLG